MDKLFRRLEGSFVRQHAAPESDPDAAGRDPHIAQEWLITNGLGGYASGTTSGLITRRFHGLLVAALPAPQGRTMMLNHLSEKVTLSTSRTAALSGREQGGTLVPGASPHLSDFRLEAGLPVWSYQIDGVNIERRICMVHGQNTVALTYTLLGEGPPVRLELQPWIDFRPHEGALSGSIEQPYALTVQAERYELAKPGFPPLRLRVFGSRAAFTIAGNRLTNVRYQIEESRGYDSSGDLYSPGFFEVDLSPGSPVALLASTETWETALAVSEIDVFAKERTRRTKLITRALLDDAGLGAELVLAADQFIITPAGRLADVARAKAGGDEVRTVIAGYHWFTDWGRDTMISLEGLTLATGRAKEAEYILRTFAYYVSDGLLPNMFPEGNNAGLYHTADASLWYFHAIDRYVELTGDESLVFDLLPTLRSIIRHHIEGTRFGIAVDPQDGLLRQGQEGYQLTWMDAKVGDYVVTPRRGKAVEINALFYNALMLLAGWEQRHGQTAAAEELYRRAELARGSFDRRFWYNEGDYLYDVIDGENGADASLRPNQLLAISLKHPILNEARWQQVIQIVEETLLTPVGLRTLAPTDPRYKAQYFGNLHARDSAYHQGTVWAWLMGPFVDAWLKVHPGQEHEAQRFLQGFNHHLSEACIGSISEIFDGDPPFVPRGCVAQAWSVAEVLRLWIKTSGQERRRSV